MTLTVCGCVLCGPCLGGRAGGALSPVSSAVSPLTPAVRETLFLSVRERDLNQLQYKGNLAITHYSKMVQT